MGIFIFEFPISEAKLDLAGGIGCEFLDWNSKISEEKLNLTGWISKNKMIFNEVLDRYCTVVR